MRIECGFGMNDFSIGVCARARTHTRTHAPTHPPARTHARPHAHPHTHTQVDAQGVNTVDCRLIWRGSSVHQPTARRGGFARTHQPPREPPARTAPCPSSASPPPAAAPAARAHALLPPASRKHTVPSLRLLRSTGSRLTPAARERLTSSPEKGLSGTRNSRKPLPLITALGSGLLALPPPSPLSPCIPAGPAAESTWFRLLCWSSSVLRLH